MTKNFLKENPHYKVPPNKNKSPPCKLFSEKISRLNQPYKLKSSKSTENRMTHNRMTHSHSDSSIRIRTTYQNGKERNYEKSECSNRTDKIEHQSRELMPEIQTHNKEFNPIKYIL